MIKSKPQDGDALVSVQEDALGNRAFVATPLFARFLDDLSSNRDSVDVSDSLAALKSEIPDSNLLIDIERLLLAFMRAQSQTVGQLEGQVHALNNEIDEMKKVIRNMEQVAWQ